MNPFASAVPCSIRQLGTRSRSPGCISLEGRRNSDAFHGQREALTHADTQTDQRAFPIGLFQLMDRAESEPCAAHSERMAKRNRAAIRIYMFRIIGNAERAQYGQRLTCESFIQF